MNSLSSDTASLLIERYKEIADVTGDMLLAAQAGEWDNVVTYGQNYCALVETLKVMQRPATLDEATRSAKYELLVKILANDAGTRDLAVPQLARMGDLLGRMKRQQTLLSAYNPKAPSA